MAASPQGVKPSLALNQHTLPLPRTVSLLPSATEIMCLVGGATQLVGRSHECDFPHHIVHDLPILTAAKNAFQSSRQMHERVAEELQSGAGLYTVDGPLLEALAPQVILTQSLCSVCSVDLTLVAAITRTMVPPPAVVSLNPQGLDDVIRDCFTVGTAVGRAAEGAAAAAALSRRLGQVRTLVAATGSSSLGKVAFLEWLDPVFIGGHWTPELIQIAGGTHPLNAAREGGGAPPSFVVPPEQVVELDPDWSGLRAVREGRVAVVDGNHMFNRPGPRLLDALEWLVGLLHDRRDIMPADFPWQMWSQPPAAAAADKPLSDGPAYARDTAACNGGGHGGGGLGGVDGVHMCARVSCAPGLPPEIEELHDAAYSSGRPTYTDPSTGYAVWTEEALRVRGHCCGNRCRHCPWGHYRVQRHGLVRTNRLTRPTLLRPEAGQSPTKAATAVPALPPHVTLLTWLGDEASHAALARLQQEHKEEVILLVAAEGRRLAWGELLRPDAARSDIGPAAMDVSLAAKTPLLFVPLGPDGSVIGDREAAGSPASVLNGGIGGVSSLERLGGCIPVCAAVLRAALRLLGSVGVTLVCIDGGTLPRCGVDGEGSGWGADQTVISIGGGETWDQVLSLVKQDTAFRDMDLSLLIYH